MKRPYGSGSLYVRSGKGGEVWHARWYIEDRDGRRQQVRRKVGPKRKPGTREGLTRTQAEAKLRTMIAESRPPQRPDELTVARAFARMLDAIDVKPQTADTYRSLYAAHLREPLGALALDRVKPRDVDQLIAGMRQGGKAPKTIRNAVSLLGRVYGHARAQGWTAADPIASVKVPRGRSGVKSAPDLPHLDRDEIPKLLAAVDPKSKLATVDRALYMTAAMTGLRQGELLALRWRDIDWAASRMHVRRNHARRHGDLTPKSDRARSVPLPDSLAGELDRLSKSTDFPGADARVFGHPVSGDVLDYSDLGRRFKATVKRAKVRPITFHGLRHTFGTQCARAGVPMRTLQAWMGHAQLATTEIYAHYAPSEHEAAMIEAAFASVAKVGPQFEPQSERNP